MQAQRPDTGDRQDALLVEHGDAIGRACMAWLGEVGGVESAVEEVFVQAIEGLAARTGAAGAQGTTRAWLFGIAQRVCARRLDAGVVRTEPLANALADTQLPGGSAVARTRRALAMLPPTERDAVVLRFVAGLTLPDVAEAMRVDVRTARERVGKGLTKMRAQLAGGT
jgi:RNA polymerase sigma-70 factor, ECF subfamily